MPILTLVEGLPKYEGINEAYAISDSLNIMRKSIDGRRNRHLRICPHTTENKDHFLSLLESKTDFLHISSHGSRIDGKTVFDIAYGGQVTADDIKERTISAKVIFVSACLAAREDMAKAFLEKSKTKHRYFIAPFKEVGFDEAFVVALLFYWQAFLKGIPIDNSKKIFQALEYACKTKGVSTNYFFWWP